MSASNSSKTSAPETKAPARRRFDFAKLDAPISMAGAAPAAIPKNQINVVLELSLNEIEEDPNQPRTEFEPEPLAELASDIKARGVQQPINVRPKDANGKYRIIQGARRYRASQLAGNSTIPAIVQSDERAFDDYAQVTENTQRENLSALDLARFIAKKKAEGESRKAIAHGLSISEQSVTYHAALLDAPESLLDAFKACRINGVNAFYELTKLLESDPEAVAGLMLGDSEITLSSIRSAKKPKPAEPPVTAQPEQSATPIIHSEAPEPKPGAESERPAFNLEHSPPFDEAPDSLPVSEQDVVPRNPVSAAGESCENDLQILGDDLPPMLEDGEVPTVVQVPFHNPALDKKEPAPADPSKIKKPLLLGKHAEREIKVLLQRTPSQVGLIHIQYEDTMEEDEVAIGEIQLTALYEMRQQEKG